MLVCGGEALIDFFPGDQAGAWTAMAAGSPVNTAIAAARLETPTAFLGSVGRDRFGDQLALHLEQSNVVTTSLHRSDASTALAIVEPGEALREPGFTIHTVDTAAALAPPPLPAGTTVLHLSGSVSMVLETCADAWVELLMSAHQAGVLVSFDPNFRPSVVGDQMAAASLMDRCLDYVDIVKVSRADLAWLAGGMDPEAIAKSWLNRHPAAIILTQAEAGSTVFTERFEASASAEPVQVVDTVGAGDTFTAGVLSTMIEAGVTSRPALDACDRDTWISAIDLGARAAAITCSRRGANPPTRAELN